MVAVMVVVVVVVMVVAVAVVVGEGGWEKRIFNIPYLPGPPTLT